VRKTFTKDFEIIVSNGEGSVTTADFLPMKHSSGVVEQIIVDAPSDAATYNFALTNPDDKLIFNRRSATGNINTDRKLTTIKGTHTISITKGTDGTYVITLSYNPFW